MPEAQTRLAGLKTGELQVIVPPIQDVKDLQKNPDVDVHIAKSTGQNMFLEFTVHRPPFNDVRARQAVSYALDKDLALKIVFGGLVQRELCPVAQGVFGHDEEFCGKFGQPHDPEKAKELLGELGYGPDNPMKMVMATWPGDSREKVLQVFQNQLKQVGIDASIEVMDIGTLNARVKQENERAEGPGFMDLMGWTWFDPDVLYLLWHSPGAHNGYTTPELDRLLEDTRTEVNPDARRAKVQEVFKVLLSEAVHVPVYTPGWLWIFAVSKKAPGFKIGPFDRPLFSDVKF
jgi:peptide/nickel transport system substrate-binding protein